jgi:hypothetical protein
MDVKDPPAPSASTMRSHLDRVYERREIIKQYIKRADDELLWDNMSAKDVPSDVIEYVQARLEEGCSFQMIRRQIGILRTTDKSWRKIMSALKQGVRIDGTAFLVQKAHEVQAMSDKLKAQIMRAFDEGIEVPTKDGIRTIKGPSKELSMTIDAWSRLQQGFVKLGKDMGAFQEEGGKGGGAGVTIVVQSNVQLPSRTDVEIHRAKLKELSASAEIVEPDASK